MFILHFIHSNQYHILWLMEELGLTHYPQHTEGTKILQLSDGNVRTYSSSLPTLPFLSLIDMQKFIMTVSCSSIFISFTSGCIKIVDPGPEKNRSELFLSQ